MENNGSFGCFPHSNAHCSTCSYHTYSHLTSLSRDGKVYFTTGLTNTHAEFSHVCRFLNASVFTCTSHSRNLLFFGRYDHVAQRLPVCSRHKENVLPRQDQCAHPSTLRALLFSYKRNGKDSLSLRKLDKHKNIYACFSTI